MTEKPQKVATIDYGAPDPTVERQWRRILLCIGLPMIGFGIARGFGADNLLNGGATAVGSFLLALVLPVRE